MALYYLLNEDHSVTPIADGQVWGTEFEQRKKRQVRRTELDDVLISTVFLGLNHGGDPPQIFETMVFQGSWCELMCWRYATWDEAVDGHEKVVALVQTKLDAGEPLTDLWACQEEE